MKINANIIIVAITLAFIASVVVSVSTQDYDTTDNPDGQRSGMKLHTDYQTGCQYLSIYKGGITPRLDVNGEQICLR